MTTGSRQDEEPASDTLIVRGGARLSGAIPISGFKHALVSCVALAAAADAVVSLHGCPAIEETRVLARLLARLGSRVQLADGLLSIDARPMRIAVLPGDDVASIHGSVYLLPALLARFGSVTMPPSGGCQIGGGTSRRRPVTQYATVFKRFGATAVEHPDGTLRITALRLHGCELDLKDFTVSRESLTGPLYSGATKMALLTAAVANGPSLLHAPYPKPDVTELVTLMRKLGVTVHLDENGSYWVQGQAGPVASAPVQHLLIPDLIEIVTWVCAGALIGGEPMTMRAPRMDDAWSALAPERLVLDQAGVRATAGKDSCTVHPAAKLEPFDVTIASHGIFSDSQPFLALLAASSHGRSTITETVWTNRFSYVASLRALGADVQVDNARLTITGPWRRAAADGGHLHASDLRAAASVLLAAAAVPAKTTLTGMRNLRRGYPDLPGQLARCGADIVKCWLGGRPPNP